MIYKNIKVEEDIFWIVKQIKANKKFKKDSDVIKMLIKLYRGKK